MDRLPAVTLLPAIALLTILSMTGLSMTGLAVDPSLAQPRPSTRADRVTGPSGYPVPRFVSLRGRTINLRRGPSTDHPIEWVYRNFEGLPVLVIAETELWRRVRDHDGVVGWIHRGLTEGRRRALVTAPSVTLREAPDPTAPARARVMGRAIGAIQSCSDAWCELTFGSVTGWVERSVLWGLLPGETID
ncbi:MAG: SH3 domain-containing protein [Alphaproteobacteria bacterium]